MGFKLNKRDSMIAFAVGTTLALGGFFTALITILTGARLRRKRLTRLLGKWIMFIGGISAVIDALAMGAILLVSQKNALAKQETEQGHRTT